MRICEVLLGSSKAIPTLSSFCSPENSIKSWGEGIRVSRSMSCCRPPRSGFLSELVMELLESKGIFLTCSRPDILKSNKICRARPNSSQKYVPCWPTLLTLRFNELYRKSWRGKEKILRSSPGITAVRVLPRIVFRRR